MIRKYNEGMGGVDVLDRMLVSYRSCLRSKKWWWNLFSNGLNMAVIAAFCFYQYLYPGDGTTHLNFRRNVAASLLKAQPHTVSDSADRLRQFQAAYDWTASTIF